MILSMPARLGSAGNEILPLQRNIRLELKLVNCMCLHPAYRASRSAAGSGMPSERVIVGGFTKSGPGHPEDPHLGKYLQSTVCAAADR